MSKKKKNTHLRLNADERPLFAPWHSVHKTKKDKENSRQALKQKLKKDMNNE